MKKSTLIAATLALSAISFGSIASDSVSKSSSMNGEYITITGSDTLDGLTAKIAQIAKDEGVKSFKVVGATGDNYLTVDAEIYR
ncbi:YdgH/BhsA/McbA-like domain containing protein [Proteus penneri]|uniref:YdgH/BhsA/McbA-like domain containing protein n=1 Tax=Proteus penneri TaxID=102862 RepID=UPI0018989153|nr:YdgH/BhsA/McbA-like domain containing protein [Proteus penneri]